MQIEVYIRNMLQGKYFIKYQDCYPFANLTMASRGLNE